jgi:hypothetical protein
VAVAEAVCEDLEIGDRVLDVLKGRIHADGVTERFPVGPVGRGGLGIRRNDAAADVVVSRLEIPEERMLGWRWYSRQGVVCG